MGQSPFTTQCNFVTIGQMTVGQITTTVMERESRRELRRFGTLSKFQFTQCSLGEASVDFGVSSNVVSASRTQLQ